jgi:hypothetical protein
VRLALAGDRLFAANQQAGWKAFDVQASLASAGGADLPDSSFGLARAGSVTYVAGYTDGVHLVSADGCGRLAWSGSVNDAGAALAVVRSGNYLYIGGAPLRVFDISSPLAPVLLPATGALEQVFDLEIANGRLVTVSHDTLRWYDLANPAAPALAGTLPLTGGARVAAQGDYAYVASEDAGLRIVNLASGTLVSTVDTPGKAYDVAVAGSKAYVADYDGLLRVIDIANPATAAEVGHLDQIPGNLALPYRVTVLGDGRVALGTFSDVRLVDVSTPTAPVLELVVPFEGRSLGDLVADGNELWVAAVDGIRRMANLIHADGFEIPGCWEKTNP